MSSSTEINKFTTIVTTENNEKAVKDSKKVLVLKLKPKKEKINIKWSEDTVDNENMGKKSSKRCCIYHKNKAFGESDSDESDSDTEKAKIESLDPHNQKPKNFQRFHA